MRSKTVDRLLKEIPLKVRIRVANQMAFINLLSELGYRSGYWTPGEDDKLKKLSELAEKLTEEHLNDIKEWQNDGCPE